MKKVILLAFVAVLTFGSCGDSSTPAPVPQEEEEKEEEEKEDGAESQRLKRTQSWFIEEATHDGLHDASSTGKTVEFFDGSSYNFDGSFDGTYEWSTDSNTVYLDKGTQFAQDWEIVKLERKSFEVNFNSPFTGKPSTWKMIIR
jgi:hypothetical protein